MPPEVFSRGDGGGGGDGGGRFKWVLWAWLALLAVGLAAAASRVVAWASERPLPFLVSFVSVYVLWGHRQSGADLPDRVFVPLVLKAVAGGIAGESLHYVLNGIPPTVPPGLQWPVIGAVGIGGAIGLGTGLFVAMAYLAYTAAVFLWGARRNRW